MPFGGFCTVSGNEEWSAVAGLFRRVGHLKVSYLGSALRMKVGRFMIYHSIYGHFQLSEVLPQCDDWYGYVRPVARPLGT